MLVAFTRGLDLAELVQRARNKDGGLGTKPGIGLLKNDAPASIHDSLYPTKQFVDGQSSHIRCRQIAIAAPPSEVARRRRALRGVRVPALQLRLQCLDNIGPNPRRRCHSDGPAVSEQAQVDEVPRLVRGEAGGNPTPDIPVIATRILVGLFMRCALHNGPGQAIRACRRLRTMM